MNFIRALSLFGGFFFSFCQCDNYFFYTTVENDKIKVNESDTQLNPVEVSWTAQAFYNASQNLTGWDILELTSNPSVQDEMQAYHAGYLEGYITREQIYNFYYNTLEELVSNKSDLSIKYTKDYLLKNNEYLQRMTTKNLNDPYWYQVHLIYKQIEGILDGYNNASKDHNNSPPSLTLMDMLMINFLEDMSSGILNPYEKTKNETNKPMNETAAFHCSALIKIIPGNSDVFIGHDTWSRFSQMNRILKRYKLAYKVSANSEELIPGMSTTFSSYPGCVASVDDFYIINSGIVAIETTLDFYNNTISKYIHPEGEVIEEVRNIVANRLATNGTTWQLYFRKNNSGTYNNQWMIVDLNHFKPGFDPTEGFLTVLEQMPGKIVVEDQTQHMLKHGYWASYNIPFYPEISYYSGNHLMGTKDPWYSFKDCPRAKIFREEQVKVTDLDSMLWLMRYNSYKTNPYSICEACTPKPNACNTIASRCDVNPVNGNYSAALGTSLFGAIDAKIVSFSMFSRGEFLAVGGPTSNGVPTFSWSNITVNATRHRGQPTTWNFQPIITSWILPYSVDPSQPDVPATTTTTTTPGGSGGKKKSLATLSQPLSIVAYFTLAWFILNIKM